MIPTQKLATAISPFAQILTAQAAKKKPQKHKATAAKVTTPAKSHMRERATTPEPAARFAHLTGACGPVIATPQRAASKPITPDPDGEAQATADFIMRASRKARGEAV